MDKQLKTIKKMEECIVINRISSQRQDEGYSLPQQSRLNKEVAERDSRRIVKEFNIIESAKASDKRDDFNEAVDFIKKNKTVQFIYIEKTDRLTRNLKDTVLAYDLVNNYDISFVFTRDNFVLNKQSNSHAKFQFDIKAVLAKNYIDNLSDEVKKGQRGMLEEGRWPGGSSTTGYKKVDKLLVPDEPRDKFVVRAFELYASGSHSLKSLKKQLDKEGFRTQNGKPLTKSNYHGMLTNPLYYGMMRWNNELYKGVHQPLIDKQLFDRVQDMLRRTKNGELIPVYAKHDLTYRGSLQCDECGCKITGEEKTKTNKGNGKVHRWIYYHCTHFRPCEQKGCTKEKDIDNDIVALFNSLDLGPSTTEWLKNKLKESHQDEIEFREKAVNDLNIRLHLLQKRLDDAYDDKLDGVIDSKTYARKKAQFVSEQGDLESLIKQHRKADQIYTDLGCLVLDVAHRAGSIYEVRKPDQKRYLMNFVFSNLSLRDKKVQHSFKLIFEALSKYKKDQNWLRD
ncbi:hypothetical protein LBMAG33_5950 [Candidatus Levyibacteriota bacterium]|nr:hypothetical protein LBMAG33_5950 [Candidatus Levybacteria bacterium]